MSYASVLNGLIEKSGMTAKDIAEKCTEMGQPLTASYISLLRQEKSNRRASDEISKALAIVLKAEYEDLLVIESYLEDAPDRIREFVAGVKDKTRDSIMSVAPKGVSNEQKQALIDKYNSVPLSDFLLYFCKKSGELNFDKSMNDAKLSISFPVKDNSMSPILQEGDNTQLDFFGKIKSGDIICYKIKKQDEYRFRKLMKVGKVLTLIPFDGSFEVERYNEENVEVIGKVTEIVRKI